MYICICVWQHFYYLRASCCFCCLSAAAESFHFSQLICGLVYVYVCALFLFSMAILAAVPPTTSAHLRQRADTLEFATLCAHLLPQGG